MSGDPASYTFSEVMLWVAEVTGAVVNYHDVRGLSYSVPRLRLTAEQRFHHGPYCSFAKLAGGQVLCGRNKIRSVETARKKRAPFWGTCPRGLWDLAVPFLDQDELSGIFYLGGFRDRTALSPAGDRVYDGPMPARITAAKRKELMHYGRFLADQMSLIVHAWRRAGGCVGKQKPERFYFDGARDFIASHYTEDVGIEDLAVLLHVHPNYLGKLIKRLAGKPFRALLQAYRLERARVMLATGMHGVTEVAYAVGFGDSNYFSTAFRKHHGVPPSTVIPAD